MQEILETLKHIETSEKINILYAAESGSRAWGFASPNSDYDVRFIYARPIEHYLSFDVELKKDVIEQTLQPQDFDIRGWDIRKALGLFTRSNGALLVQACLKVIKDVMPEREYVIRHVDGFYIMLIGQLWRRMQSYSAKRSKS